MRNYFAFQWHITDECDQRCKHCYIFSENNDKKIEMMSFDEMQEVIANCEDFCIVYNRYPYFYITGGDPILHPDFWRLAELLRSKDISRTAMYMRAEECRTAEFPISLRTGLPMCG